jgi:hypothetical protein
VLWVIVFAAIAVAGLVMLVCYGVWLTHKTADVLSEVGVLADRGAQLGELLGQIQVPQAALGAGDPDALRAGDPDALRAGGPDGSRLVRVPEGLTRGDVR